MPSLNPRINWQRDEVSRQKLAVIVGDYVIQDALTICLAIMAKNASAMPDAAAYLRGAKDLIHQLLNLSVIEQERKTMDFGLPNPMDNK